MPTSSSATTRGFFAAPASEASLASLYQRHPDARIIGGATDVGLWITKQLATIDKIIHVGRAGLDEIEEAADALHIGASVTLARATPPLASIDPDIAEILRRFGSVQVRAAGTVGGNIANGSPIGDLAPLLIALGGSVELRKGDAVRALPLEQFFIAYGKQDRASRANSSGALIVPKLPAANHASRLQDHQAVRRGHLRRDGGVPVRARRRPHRLRRASPSAAWRQRRSAPAVEKRAGRARRCDDAGSWRRWRSSALGEDFTPMTDMRASAAYRLEVARNLLNKALVGDRRRIDPRDAHPRIPGRLSMSRD